MKTKLRKEIGKEIQKITQKELKQQSKEFNTHNCDIAYLSANDIFFMKAIETIAKILIKKKLTTDQEFDEMLLKELKKKK